MATDADIVPQALSDFVFDLYDSVTLSQLTEEQNRLYNNVFRDLSQKYFASTPWPSPTAVAAECNGDPLFLAFYRELTHRHWHAVSRPPLRERMEGWDVYRELFDELLEGADIDSTSAQPKLYILPEWAFDILNEFVYQFQGFCQFRTTLFFTAEKFKLLDNPTSTRNDGFPEDEDGISSPTTTGGDVVSGKRVPLHLIENLSLIQEDAAQDVWSVDTVMYYLNRLVEIGTNPKCIVPAYQYFGIFASVALSRLECLLSDYSASLSSLVPVLENPTSKVIKDGQETKNFTQVIHSVFPARLSLTYHAGISFLMLRRYKDAVTTVGDLCTFMHRGMKTGQFRSMPYADQLFRNYDRMIALLAICTHICPQTNLVDESITKAVREKHGALMLKDAYTELFNSCAPKFISPAIPDYITGASIDNAFKHQLSRLEQELKDQSDFRALRSYLKLYTSIPVSKLLKFGNKPNTLSNLKVKMHQLESTNSDIPSLKENICKSALDIHYYAEKMDGNDDEIVHIDEAEKQRRFENYFFGQITQSYEIRKSANKIDTTV